MKASIFCPRRSLRHGAVGALLVSLLPAAAQTSFPSRAIVETIPAFSATDYLPAQNPGMWRGKLFFSQLTSYGRELWVTDGTAAGTRQVIDLAPGEPGSEPVPFTTPDVAPGLLFSADSGGSRGGDEQGSGRELWITDGTASGTAKISELAPGPHSSIPADVVWFKGRGYFVGRAGTTLAVYATDGTAAGTSIFRSFAEGGSRRSMRLVAGSARMWMVVTYQVSQITEVWTTDGTPAATALLGTLPTTFRLNRVFGTGPGDRLWIGVPDAEHGEELWTADGAGLSLLKDLVPGPQGSDIQPTPPGLLPSGVAIFATIQQFNQPPRVWRSDGTADGTFMLGELSYGGNDGLFVESGGLVYFPVFGDTTGYELWRTDGTVAGTFITKDIVPGVAQGTPPPFSRTNINGTLFFAAGDATIWKTNGTEATTVQVSPSMADVSAGYRTGGSAGGLFIFPGVENNRRGLYRTDGSPAGTVRFAGPWPSAPRYEPRPLAAANNTIFFTNGSFATNDEEVWRTDGTPGGSFSLGVEGGTAFRVRYDMIASAGTLFFPGVTPGSGRQGLFRSDGTLAGTLPVRDLGEYGFIDVRHLASVNGGVAFSRLVDGEGGEPWFSDGTEAGTIPMGEIRPGPLDSFSGPFVGFSGGVIFGADDGTQGLELWRKPQGAAPAGFFRNLAPETDVPQHSHPREFMVLNGKFLFTATAGDGSQRVLWVSDGTPSGTQPVPCAAGDPRGLVRLGNAVLFSAKDGTSGRELWTSDGTAAGTRLILDINPGAGAEHSSSPEYLTLAGSAIYFAANDGTKGIELWRSDGTATGTRLVRDILEGPGSSSPRLLTAANGHLAFTALDAEHGRELWTSDGTQADTQLAEDTFPGPADSAITRMAAAHDSVFWYGRSPGSIRPGLRATTLP